MIRVHLPSDLYAKTNQFCVDVHKARKARDANNKDNGMGRLADETIGKIGEVAVAYQFNKLHLVDWNIYPDGKPSFAPDLGIIHVKTCKSDYYGGDYDSWTVDKKDPIYLKPKQKEDIILTYADLKGCVSIYGRILAVMAQPHWKNCKQDHMSHKQAVYRCDVDDIIEKLNL